MYISCVDFENQMVRGSILVDALSVQLNAHLISVYVLWLVFWHIIVTVYNIMLYWKLSKSKLDPILYEKYRPKETHFSLKP